MSLSRKHIIIVFLVFILAVVVIITIKSQQTGVFSSFSGKITQIGRDNFSIHDDITKSTIKIGISNKTNITTGKVIPYLLKYSPPTLKFSDLTIGMYVTGSARNGEAITINDLSISYVLFGKIIEIKDKNIVIQSLKHSSPAAELIKKDTEITPQEKNYNIIITDLTEISSIAPAASLTGNSAPPNPKPIQYTLKGLKKGKQVNVYTTDDVNKVTNITALRIEPIIEIKLPSPSPTQITPSSSPSKSNVLPPLPAPKLNDIAPRLKSPLE